LPAGGKPQTLAEAGKRVAAAKTQIYKDVNIGRVIRRASTVNAGKPKHVSVYVRSDYSLQQISNTANRGAVKIVTSRAVNVTNVSEGRESEREMRPAHRAGSSGLCAGN
jgi:hypothetical protein